MWSSKTFSSFMIFSTLYRDLVHSRQRYLWPQNERNFLKKKKNKPQRFWIFQPFTFLNLRNEKEIIQKTRRLIFNRVGIETDVV